MSRFLAVLALATVFGVPFSELAAQSAYTGLRAALFDFRILEVKNRSVLFTCRIANTGRETTGANASTIIELDTLNLPALLWGLEPQIAEAARSRIPKLQPGTLSEPVWMEVTAPAPADRPAGDAPQCLDVVLDSVSLVKFDQNTMQLRYILRNNGKQAITLAGPEASTTIRAYFVSGARLTRGAIPAGSTQLQQGVESLTGQLTPGQKLAGDLTFKLTNRTKFSPNILLEMVLPGGVSACNLTRNTAVINLE